MKTTNEMTVSLDFPDHWRVRMLVELLKEDEAAPLYVMRLWAYSLRRGARTFRMPAPVLKAVCRYLGAADVLEQALVSAYFVERDGKEITVIPWAE